MSTYIEKQLKSQTNDLCYDTYIRSSHKGTGTVDGSTINGKCIGDMTKQEIIDNVPDDWNIYDNNGFIHIKDKISRTIIEIHPSDGVTNYSHIHIYDEIGNPLDINGNIGDRKSPDVHIPLIKD